MGELYVGLMSGTSIDAVDAVVAEFDGERFIRLHATHRHGYPEDLRARLLAMSIDLQPLSAREYCEVDIAVGDAFSGAAKALLRTSGIDPAGISAIGSHGQTVFHDGNAGLTLQLGDPNRIAAGTGIATVADFRRLDLALGGQGAPLVPAFHQALFSNSNECRCVLNLGGIANITVLPIEGAVIGFDTGPGNGLMDEWMLRERNARYDDDGRFAASGRVVPGLVGTLLADPYFALAAPKSTGRDYFRLEWMFQRYPAYIALEPHHVQASLAHVTVQSVAEAIKRSAPNLDRLLVCGGGARNGEVMRLLKAAVSPVIVETTDDHGLPADWIEATAFAWLAMRRFHGLPGNLPTVTGARRSAALGGVYLSHAAGA